MNCVMIKFNDGKYLECGVPDPLANAIAEILRESKYHVIEEYDGQYFLDGIEQEQAEQI